MCHLPARDCLDLMGGARFCEVRFKGRHTGHHLEQLMDSGSYEFRGQVRLSSAAANLFNNWH